MRIRSKLYTVQNIRISADISWRVFHILTDAMWTRTLIFRRFTDTNVYGTGFVKRRKIRHRISVVIRIFFLQCIEARPRSGADGRSLVSRDTVVEILQECVSIFSTSDLNQRFLSVNSPELGLGLGLARQITRSQLTSFKSYCPHRDRQTRTQTD